MFGKIQLLASALIAIALIPPAVVAQQPSAQPPAGTSIIFDSGGLVTPSTDIDNYLRIMRRLLQRYEQTTMNLLMGGGSVSKNPDDFKAGAQETQELADEMNAVRAPREVAAEHAQLAASLGVVQSFTAAGGAAKQGLPRALGLAQQIQGTISRYHTAVLAMIRAHGLPVSKDPFAVETAGAKQQVMQGLMSQLANMAGGLGGTAAPMGGMPAPTMPGGAAGSMLGAPAFAGTDNTAGALGSPDLSGLMNGMGGAGAMSGLLDGLGGASGASGLLNGLGGASGASGLLNGLGGASGAPGLLNGSGAGLNGLLNGGNGSSGSPSVDDLLKGN